MVPDRHRRLQRLLLGRDRRDTRRFLAFASGVAVLFGAGPYVLGGLSIGVPTIRYVQAMVVVPFVAAAANAYRNEGLVVSWLLAAAGLFPFALTFALTDAPIGREPTLSNATSELLGSAGLYGVVVGTAGFVAGIVVRGFLNPQGGRSDDERSLRDG